MLKVVALILSFGGPFSLAASQERLYLLGERQGEVEPCGCPRVQLGGLQRLVAFVESARRKQPSQERFVWDTGNSFFSLPQLPESRRGQSRAKADLIADAYRILGVQVLVPGPRDLALGAQELARLAKRAGLSLVSANLRGIPQVQAHIRVGKWGVTGVGDDQSPLSVGTWVPALVAAKQALKDLKQEGAPRTVLLLQSGLAEEAYSELGYDLVLKAPEPGGKRVAYLDWEATRTGAPSLTEVDLDPAWEKPNLLKPAYNRYLAELKSNARKPSPKPTRTQGAFVAQPGLCRTCHEKQYAFWEGTKHASAYLVLFARDQNLNPECIGCHSLGFGEKQGFMDILQPIQIRSQKTGQLPFVETFMQEVFSGDSGSGPLDSRLQPQRYAQLKKRYHEKIHQWQSQDQIVHLHMGVQCEHCHGNRNGHPSASFKRVGPVRPSRCVTCHHPPHDETFDFEKRVKQVACPKR